MSETIEISGAGLDRGKILRFPTPLSGTDGQPTVGDGLADRRGLLGLVPAESGQPSPPVAAEKPLSAWKRLSLVRRRRDGSRSEYADSASPLIDADRGTPSVSQVVTWMLNLRQGGVGYLYWNAAKLPLDVALTRVARLDDAATIEVVGHRLLVVEPLHPRPGAALVQ